MKLKIDPSPTRLSTLTSPPWAWMISLAMDNPNPMPDFSS
jgi:hypothetical protein